MYGRQRAAVSGVQGLEQVRRFAPAYLAHHEMRRVLKPTGSIYLHCDPTASHYLKAVMDAIFGWKNFRNEIVWCYAKTGEFCYRPVYRPYSAGTQQRGRTPVKGKYFERGLNPEGTPVNDWWADVKRIASPTDPEKTG